MIAHRAHRDITRCRAKYGEAWLEYERQVPYLFIPVGFFPSLIIQKKAKIFNISLTYQ